jgi:DNA-binding beta-propeller fold protein YncE
VGLNVSAAGAVAILDTSTGSVINTIDLTGGPNLPQISPNGKFAYVPMATGSGSDIIVLDTATQKVKKTIPVTSFPDAVSVVFNRSGSIAYVTGFNLLTGAGYVAEIDTATLKLTHTVSVDAFTIYSIANRTTNDVWTVGANGSSGGGFNAINVIKGHNVIVTTTPPAGVSIGYPAFTPNGKYAYMPEAYLNGSTYNYVYLTDTKTYLPVGTPIQVGNEPYIVQIAHNGKYAYVGNQVDETVSVIQISPTQ